MTRRALTILLHLTVAAQHDPKELEASFNEVLNNFIIAMNNLMGYKLRGLWDVRAAAAVEKAFKNLTNHPGWVRVK